MKKQTITHLSVYQYVFVMLAALVVFALSASVSARHTIVGLEKQVFDSLYNMVYLPPLLMLAITQLGSVWFLLTLTIVMFTNKRKSLALRLVLVGGLTYVMVELSKVVVARPRPEFLLPDVLPKEQFVTGQGFPSGHTALITAIGLILLPVIPRRWQWLVPTAIVLVGLSRIYLGVHAPLDVIGGFSIGIIVAFSYYLGANLAKKTTLAKRTKRA